jgi:hypothetical protein
MTTLSWRRGLLGLSFPGPSRFDSRLLLSYAFLGAAGSSWLFAHWIDPSRRRLQIGPLFFFVPLIGFILLGIAGIPFAFDGEYALSRILYLSLALALYLLMVNIQITPAAVAWPLAAGIALQALVALGQFKRGGSIGLGILGEGQLDPAIPPTSILMVGAQRILRPYGLTMHPNVLGGYLMASILIVLAHSLGGSRRRMALFVPLTLGGSALLVTFSRSAWLGAAMGGATAFVIVALFRAQCGLLLDRVRIVTLAVVAVGIVAAFAVTQWPLLATRLGLVQQGVEIRSVDERIWHMENAWLLIRLRPLIGVGLGNYATALVQLIPEPAVRYPVASEFVHHVALLSTAELGILGGLLWTVLLVAPWLALWFRRKRIHMTMWWAGLSGALVALAVASCLDMYTWVFHEGRLLQWLVWGLWANEWMRSAAPTHAASPRT